MGECAPAPTPPLVGSGLLLLVGPVLVAGPVLYGTVLRVGSVLLVGKAASADGTGRRYSASWPVCHVTAEPAGGAAEELWVRSVRHLS